MRSLLLLSLVFALELTALSISVDGADLLSARSGFFGQLLGGFGSPAIQFLVSLAALSAAFAFAARRVVVNDFLRRIARARVSSRTAIPHLALFVSLILLARHVYAGGSDQPALTAVLPVLGIAVLLSGVAMVTPLAAWWRLVRSIGSIGAYAAAAAFAAVAMTRGWRALWQTASVVTFHLVRILLRPFVGQLIVDPRRLRIATSRFGVVVAPECSGLEGMGLLIVFVGAWLWFNRAEYRFPRALLLLPAGISLLFFLNSVRIAGLVLIGHAGAPQVALGGFHSQAGWIAFNAVALGMCAGAGRVPWLASSGTLASAGEFVSSGNRPPEIADDINPVAVWLGPFLAVVAAGILSQAMTGGFEWFYFLRIPAAFGLLWRYRREYSKIDGTFSWRGPACGLLVFAVWIALERAGGHAISGAPPAIRDAPELLRAGWIGSRVLGAVVVVPVVEELAFRGYLLRRLQSVDFEQVPLNRLSLMALVISSVLFGAMHGGRWLAGIVAGLLYALVSLRRGQLAEAVVAHAVTNGLIAIAVLGPGWWNLW